jgi:hypothetical protein
MATKEEVLHKVTERAAELRREIAKTKSAGGVTMAAKPLERAQARLDECLFWIEQGLTTDGEKK